ncbi:MAG: imidazoleglycerol-phosphate dehydratase HisB [Lachnospiraceae bacterium]|nr:imidazoleglycerol-phosphate dehydratase HisB [Lachnospiraceae bacterium]
MSRISEVARKTLETDIVISVDLDGTGKADIDTGIGFFDHMLNSFSRHSGFDMKVRAKGDLYVDQHHTVEDTGIVLGQTILKALGDKAGINRYGDCILPMDEALVLSAVDLCGRPYFCYDADFTGTPLIGAYDSSLTREFFYAVSYSAAMNLHIKVLNNGNAHHVTEAMFKAFARAMNQAVSVTRGDAIPSTKGAL